MKARLVWPLMTLALFVPAVATGQHQKRTIAAAGAGSGVRIDSTYDTFTDSTSLTVENAPMLQLNRSAFLTPEWSCVRNFACVLNGFNLVMTMAADSWALRSSGAARARWEQFASSTLLRWDFMVLDGADTTRFSVEHATVQFQALITESRTIVAHRLLSEPEVVSALSHGTELRVRQRIFTIASPKGNGFELKGASAWLRAVQASNRRVVAERQSATERLIASAMMLIPPISAPDAFGERESGADSVDRDPSEHASRVYKAAEAIPGMGPPAYPKALKSSGVEGEAIVQFIVDTTGRAELPSFTVLRATHILFGDAVKAALPRMRFLPAEIDGRKVRMRVTQNFSFALTKK